MPAFTAGSLISAGLLSALRDRDLSTQLWGPPLQARIGCVSHDVDLEALKESVLANYSRGICKPLSGRKVRHKGINQRKIRVGIKGEWSQLPGIQCHSSPCRSLVVWGRRALSVRSSPPLCLETKDKGVKPTLAEAMC